MAGFTVAGTSLNYAFDNQLPRSYERFSERIGAACFVLALISFAGQL